MPRHDAREGCPHSGGPRRDRVDQLKAPDASLEHQAAAVLHSLVRNHALVDGNKRLGWLATAVFLDINSHPPDMTDDEAFELVMAVSDGTLDVVEIDERLGSE